MSYVDVNRQFERGAQLVTKLKQTGNMPLAGAYVDPYIASEHVLLSGRTGAGKTQVLLPLINYITCKAQFTNNTIAIITDISGEFVSKFYNPETDYILNPFDERSQKWNPFAEIEDKSDCTMLAEALVERSGSSNAREWEMYAERIIADSLNALHYTDDFKLKDQINVLFRILSCQEPEFAAQVLEGTQSAGYFNEANSKMLGNVSQIASGSIRGLAQLEQEGTFSVRKWLTKAVSGEDRKVLWIPYLPKDRPALKTLIATWLNLLVLQTLSLTPDRNRQIFCVMDELDSLGKVERLKDALTLGRKYGLCTIGAIQNLSQLEDTYGKNDARTLLGNFNNKIIMAQADYETAEFFSKTLGTYEETVKTTTVSTSQSKSTGPNSSNSTNQSMSEQETKDRNIFLVTPTQLTALEKLTGYALLVGASTNGIQNVFKFRLSVTDFIKMADNFVKKGEHERRYKADRSTKEGLEKLAGRFWTQEDIENYNQKVEEQKQLQQNTKKSIKQDNKMNKALFVVYTLAGVLAAYLFYLYK